MGRILLTIAITIILASYSFAADIPLEWDASAGATGYKLQISTTRGRSWGEIRDTGSAKTEYVWRGAPDKGLLMFRIMSYNAHGKAWNTTHGVWVKPQRK